MNGMVAMRLDELLRRARELLAEAGIAEAATDARLLVAHITQTGPHEALLRPDLMVDAAHVSTVFDAVTHRAGGEPVHRIIGRREFYGLPFRLSPATLEPRPDTEILVDAVLSHAQGRASSRAESPGVAEMRLEQGAPRILDLGTGSGAIAIALLHELPEATAVAVDISAQALETAASNAQLSGVDMRFVALRSDWFSSVRDSFDIIVSNPPYIETDAVASLEREVREHDPVAALDGGPDGLSAYRLIAGHADPYLTPDGIVAVEIGAGQAKAVVELFARNGYALVESRKDLGGHERALVFARAQQM